MANSGYPAQWTALWREFVFACMCALAVLIAGCGGDSGSGAASSGPTAGPLVRLQVTPAAVTFTSSGATRKLQVHGYDANGTEVPVTAPVFASSDTTVATIAADGTLQAVAGLGSSVVDVRVGTVVASPVTVLALHLADGVVAVSDDQVVTAPVVVGTGADARVHVTLTGAGTGTLAPGSLLAGTGGIPLAGVVTAATVAGANVTVDMQDVPITSLVKDLAVNVSYTADQVNAASDIGALSASGSVAAQAGRAHVLSVDGRASAQSVKIGPFECTSGMDLALLHGEFEGSMSPPNITFDIAHEVVNGIKTRTAVVAKGTMGANLKGIFRLGTTLTADVSCTARLGRLTAPVFGLLSAIVAPSIPLGVEFDLTGQASYAAFSLGANDALTATAQVGFSSDADGTTVYDTFDTDNKFTPVATFPTDQGLRAKVTAFGGLASGMDLSIGNIGILSLTRLELVKILGGPEMEARVTGPYGGAIDSTFDSGYDLKIKTSLQPGEDIIKATEALLLSSKAIDFSVKQEVPLAHSPTASSLKVDKTTFNVGDVLNFSVTLDSTNASFPLVGYNVGEVRIYRLDASLQTATLVASAPATDGQTAFALTWTADASGTASDAGTPTFFAFVVDVPLKIVSSALPFELGAVQGPVGFGSRLAGTGTSSMVVRDDGTVMVRGTNNGGALGLGWSSNIGGAYGPTLIPNLSGIRAVTGDAWFGAAMTDDGSLWVWGWGVPIESTLTNNPQPFPKYSDTGMLAMSSGYDHTLEILKDGSVYGFGANPNGVLGPYGDTGLGPATAIAAGGTVSLALHADGTVWAIGRGTEGQLGNGAFVDSATPVQVSGLSNVTAIAAGNTFAMALTADGHVYAWGENQFGTLGNGTRVKSALPVLVTGLVGVTRISCGDNHALALADGVVYTWGAGTYGQLGAGDTADRLQPTSVLTGAVDIDGGEFHSLALLADGTVMGWGHNGLGQVDDSGTARILTPAPTGLTTH